MVYLLTDTDDNTDAVPHTSTNSKPQSESVIPKRLSEESQSVVIMIPKTSGASKASTSA